MIECIILIVISALLNAARGSGKIKKVIVYAIHGLLTAACFYSFTSEYWLIGLAVFFIDYLCNSFGWGDFYPHGRKSNTGDFYPARWCADLFFAEENKEQTVKWQIAAMSFRFFLTFGAIGTPVLAYIAQDWRYLAVAPLYLLSGLIYRVFLMNETKKSLRNAEYANGAWQGAILGILLILLMAEGVV